LCDVYLIALIAEILTSLLLVVALAIRRWRKWTVGTLLVLKVAVAALMLTYGFEFALRPLRDLVLLAVAASLPRPLPSCWICCCHKPFHSGLSSHCSRWSGCWSRCRYDAGSRPWRLSC
jgi:hypothetical protein